MKNNSKKHEGFTLIEVVISMALIAIISIGVYNGYLLLIRQTKEGQVKQTATLAGKKTIEVIKSINNIDDEDDAITLRQDDKNIILSKTGDSYTNELIHLDNDFNICNDQSDDDYKYTQQITLKPVKDSQENEINIDKNNKSNNISGNNILEDYLYLGKDETGAYIRDNSSKKIIESQSGKVRIYIYLKSKDNKKLISIKDSYGNILLDEKELGTVLDESNDKRNEINIYMNFKEYIKDLEPVEVYVINKDEEENCETNIYLQKPSEVNVNVTFDEGKGYIYNNRAEDNNKIGALYDIEVKIKKKGSEDSLFTGYSSQNININ